MLKKRKNILVVGYFISHIVGSKVELLKGMGYNVHALDIGDYNLIENVYYPDSLHIYSNANFIRKHKRLIHRCKDKIVGIVRDLEFINEEDGVSKMANHLIKEIEPDVIWGIWGPTSLKWFRAFRKVGFREKMCWTANVFPNRFNSMKSFKWSSEHILYNKWLHKIDGIILTGHRMLKFIHQRYPKTTNSNYLLLPDYLPQTWFAKKVDTLVDNNEIHIVYLGAPERYGKEIDRIDSYLLEIAENGIHVHCSRPKEIRINHPLIHFYDRFNDSSFVNGEFGQFINRFHAAIVLYNYKRYHPRFASTFPTRFLVALCGCIPIFIKKGLLFNCENFVENNDIGRTYKNIVELKKMLMDSGLMYKLREKAKQNPAKFASDNIKNKFLLKDFLENL